MLNFDTAASTIQSLDDAPSRSILDISFHHSAEVTKEAQYLAKIGVLGVLPIAKYPSGDGIALRGIPGQPMNRWHVVHVSHIGEGLRTLCSRPSHLMAALLLRNRPLPQALETLTGPILSLSSWLGDTEGITESLINQLRGDTPDTLPFSVADPDSMLARFNDVYARVRSGNGDSIGLWRELVEQDARFAPAQTLLFRALLNANNDTPAIPQAAWEVFMLHHGCDNVDMVEAIRQPNFGWSDQNPIIAAAQTLVEQDAPESVGELYDLFLPAVTALAEDEDAYDGSAHLEAAQNLLNQQQLDLGWTACQNAAHWRSYSQEAAYPQALDLSLQIARAWKQQDLVDVMTLAQPEAPASIVPQEKTATQAPPPDYEATSAIKQAIQRLTHEDVVMVAGDFLLAYRYGRWNWMVVSYFFQTKGITSLAILTHQKLVNLLSSFSAENLSGFLQPLEDLPADFQEELRYKLLPEVAEYHYLMERNLIYIMGGATTDQTVTPQLEIEQRRDLTEKILTEGGYGRFAFTELWQEIKQALDERSNQDNPNTE